MTDTEYRHQPVLLSEALDALTIQPSGIYVDATFGRGGHSGAILERLGVEGRLLAIDQDPEAVAVGVQKYGQDVRFSMERGSFAMLRTLLLERNWLGQVNGILLDLGVSSPQLDDPKRGFSFLREGPLDMRMDPDQGISAADWIRTAREEEIAEVLKTYGEERYAKRIARAILNQRKAKPIETTSQLAAIISAANPAWERDKHPATRSFLAIRIFINRELDALKICLSTCLEALANHGRLVVMSFHSLEDRLVKNFMRQYAECTDIPRSVPLRQAELPRRLRIVGRAQRASDDEIQQNPRARSVVLRVVEKCS